MSQRRLSKWGPRARWRGGLQQSLASFGAWLVALTLTGAPAARATPWVARYEGPGDDVALKLAVSDSGFVYVTGRSPATGTGQDILTLKYSPAGVLLWSERYDGPAHGNDIPAAMAVTPEGGVVVVGSSAGGGEDLVAIKYGAGGSEDWVRRYGGTAGANDFGSAVVVLGDGSVVVGGATWRAGQALDELLIRYSAAGGEMWVKIDSAGAGHDDVVTALASGPGGFAVAAIDADSSGLGDYHLRLVAPDGSTLLSLLLDGSGHKDDWPLAVATDAAGNVVATGLSVGPDTSADCWTVRMAAGGGLGWESRFVGTGGRLDAGEAIATGADGTTYVAGLTFGAANQLDALALHLDTSGNLDWSRTYDGAGTGLDEATSLALDARGRLIVAGQTTQAGGGTDIAVLAYTPEGASLLRWFYDGPAHGEDFPAQVAPLGAGYVITGSSQGVGTGADFVTLFVDSSTSVASVTNPVRLPQRFTTRLLTGNPASDQVAVELALPSAGKLSVELYDLQGRHAAGWRRQLELARGVHVVNLETAALPSGTYFVRVSGTVGASPVREILKVTRIR